MLQAFCFLFYAQFLSPFGYALQFALHSTKRFQILLAFAVVLICFSSSIGLAFPFLPLILDGPYADLDIRVKA